MGPVIVILILVVGGWLFLARPVAPPPALPPGDAGRDRRSATRSSPPAGCMRSCARRASRSCGSRSLPASSSRSTGGPSRRSPTMSLLRGRLAGTRRQPRARRRPRRRTSANRLTFIRLASRRSHLTLIALLVAALVGVALLGVPGSPFHRTLRQGLDLQGGLEVVLQAQPKRGQPLTSAEMTNSISIMRTRVDKLGVSEPVITKQGTNQIVIELPAVHDPTQAAKIIGQTAQLELYDLTPSLLGPSIDAHARTRSPTRACSTCSRSFRAARRGRRRRTTSSTRARRRSSPGPTRPSRRSSGTRSC